MTRERCPPSRREILRGGLSLLSLGVMTPAWIAARAAAAPEEGAAGMPVYPDDAFSRPAEDRWPHFETLDGCAPAGNPRERSVQFTENVLRLVTGADGSQARWTFRSREQRQAVLMLQGKIRRAPEAISLRVRNASARPVDLEMLAQELTWFPERENRAVAWKLGLLQRVDPGEERMLRFPFAEAFWPGRAEPAAPRYPMIALMLAAEEIEPGEPYALLFRGLTVHYPPAPGLRVTMLDAPPVLLAGKEASFRVQASGDTGERTDLELRRDPWVLWRIRLAPEERAALASGSCVVQRAVPWYLPPGDYTLGLVAGGCRVAGPEARLRVANSAHSSLPKAERKLHRGRPAFFVNGRPFPWQGYSSYDYQPGPVAEFGASGTNVFCVPTCAGQHLHHVAASTWITPGRFDFGELDERIAFSLQANPDALLFLRVSLTLPSFWAQAHEAELAQAATEVGPVLWEETGTQGAALASRAWRRDQERALRALLRHCKAQPWAGRLAGFWLTAEVTEEWFAWGCNDGFYSDYSAPNQAGFAAWLEEHPQYGPASNPAAPIPLPEARRKPGWDVYPDDSNGRLAAGYHQYLSDLTAETISHFARIVKEATGGRSLVGAFYGYVIELAGEARQALSGHFGVRRLLDDPNVDFLGGVPLLDFRDLSNGYNPYCSATESVLAAGKLVCSENDMFSWLHPILWHTLYDPKDPRGGAISMHRRECANDAVHGTMAQKFSLMASWHHDAALQADFARQKAILARALNLDRAPVEEIAFVVDDSSMAWTPPETTLLHAAHKQLLYRLGRTGMPVGVWLLSDLHRLPARIRFVVVAHAAAALPEDLAKLDALLRQGRRTVLVVGAPGLVDRRAARWDRDAPARLLDLPLRLGEEAGKQTVVTTADGSVVTSIAPVRPRAWLEGSGLMRYTDGATAGAERPLPGDGRLLWCGVPPLSTPLLRRWALDAGVHAYAPAEYFVHAARELVAVTAPVAGMTPLRFPVSVAITDLFDGWEGAGREISCPFMPGQTRLFHVTPRTNG